MDVALSLKRGTLSDGADQCCYVEMAWIRVRNMPKHHFNESAAAALVNRFGKLSSIDMEKASVDYSSFDMLVECNDAQSIPREVMLFYDELYRKIVFIDVHFWMDVVSFDRLGYGSCTLSYAQIYDFALNGRNAGTLGMDGLTIV